MYRLTTPTHTFQLPFQADTIDRLLLTYKQHDQTVLEKTENDVAKEGNSIIVTLTQEETQKFRAMPSKVQLRVKIGTTVMASQILFMSVEDVLNTEVL